MTKKLPHRYETRGCSQLTEQEALSISIGDDKTDILM